MAARRKGRGSADRSLLVGLALSALGDPKVRREVHRIASRLRPDGTIGRAVRRRRVIRPSRATSD